MPSSSRSLWWLLAGVVLLGGLLVVAIGPGVPVLDDVIDQSGFDDSDEGPAEITYSVAYEDGLDRNLTALLTDSVAFWERDDRNPDDYDFRRVSDADSPDVRFVFTGLLDECDGETTNGTFYTCFEEGDDDEPTRIEIPNAFTTDSMRQILRYTVGVYSGHEQPERFDGVTSIREQSPEYLDPWPTNSEVVVNLSVQHDPNRDWEPLVREGIEYWQANDDRYGNYTENFVFRPEAADADVTVSVVEEIQQCGVEDGSSAILGCAELYDRDVLANDVTSVRVETGYTDQTTLDVVKHEFGHVYGLRHGQEPMPLMAERYTNATRQPQLDATERDSPFGTDDLSVYVDHDSLDGSRSDVRQQVTYAMDYYNAGADGAVPQTVNLTYTPNEADAHIVVRGGTIDRCTGVSGAGSCGISSGNDTDADGALEFYTRQRITLQNLDTDVVGWHVGYWLARSLGGAETESGLPAPFRDDDSENRRNWWK